MDDLWKTIALALVPMIPGFVALYAQRKKNQAEAKKIEADAEISDADAADKVTQTALILIKPLKERIAELNCEIVELRNINKEQNKQIMELRKINEEQGAQIAELKSIIATFEAEREELIKGIDDLVKQISLRGDTPIWTPRRLKRFTE